MDIYIYTYVIHIHSIYVAVVWLNYGGKNLLKKMLHSLEGNLRNL